MVQLHHVRMVHPRVVRGGECRRYWRHDDITTDEYRSRLTRDIASDHRQQHGELHTNDDRELERSFDNTELIKGNAEYRSHRADGDIRTVSYPFEELLVPEASGDQLPFGDGHTVGVSLKLDRFGNAVARHFVVRRREVRPSARLAFPERARTYTSLASAAPRVRRIAHVATISWQGRYDMIAWVVRGLAIMLVTRAVRSWLGGDDEKKRQRERERPTRAA